MSAERDVVPSRVVLDGLGFVECPRFDPELGVFFADETNGGVWAVPDHPRAGPRLLSPHRRGISGLGLHEDGRLVMTGRNVALKPVGSSSTGVVIPGGAPGRLAFSDLTVDRTGRVVVSALGSIPEDGRVPGASPPGQVLVIARDGSVRVLDDTLPMPNGLDVSPSGDRLYVADTIRREIYASWCGADGDFGPLEPFARLQRGRPDGLAVTTEGEVWVANLDGGGVSCFGADGTHLRDLDLGLVVTSLCFGDADLGTLYVTAIEGQGPRGRGSVRAARGLATGQPLRRAHIAVPAADDPGAA